MIYKKNTYNYLQQYVDNLQADGRNSFSLREIEEQFHQNSKALKASLNRLVKKRKIVSVRKGFYVIIPPEYLHKNILPPVLFIDQLMKYLCKEYYIGLRSAALLHGAAHQQPQVFDVIVENPPLRDIHTNNLNIIFYTKNRISKNLLENMKTDSGFVSVSNPVLTALDLIQFQKRVGGIVRVAEIIMELSEQFQINMIKSALKNNKIKISFWQRLGYLIEKFGMEKFSDIVYEKTNDRFYRIPLSTLHKTQEKKPDNRWKIIENIELDIL